MIHLFKSKIGRLRILGFLEGITLLGLVFIAVPMKYLFDNPEWSKTLGPIHGAIFIVFMLNTFSLSIEHNWSFKSFTWKILLASFIPFGTFYIDHKYFKHMQDKF
ncbi:MAG: DUF3817 domain-containing protein [Saprospiraceae bacterium]|nr:DUF3817 domain-containing protein [Saprospiraceae bacterium]MBK7811120.1 DUF3817 domain-containing protein [Saprospiraceae bacterium]MBK9630718.1 DUF3817 domain-containing protein [Saprospiraceae bacterium]